MKKVFTMFTILITLLAIAIPASATVILYDSNRDITLFITAEPEAGGAIIDYYKIALTDMDNPHFPIQYKTFDDTFVIDALKTHGIYKVEVTGWTIDGDPIFIGEKYFCFAVEDSTSTFICNCPECPAYPTKVFYATTGAGWWTGMAFMNATEKRQTITWLMDGQVYYMDMEANTTKTFLLSNLVQGLKDGAHVINLIEPVDKTDLYVIMSDGTVAVGK